MSAKESHDRAARCFRMAEETPSPKLKANLVAQAEAWNRLAEEQERIEWRAAERRARESLHTSPD